jgi:hypothetical protein
VFIERGVAAAGQLDAVVARMHQIGGVAARQELTA